MKFAAGIKSIFLCRRIIECLQAKPKKEFSAKVAAYLEARQKLEARLFPDIQMPDLNGFELLAKLKNYPPVIFTTAFDEYALRAFEVNSLDYLLKPVEAERLENALNKLVKRRSERLSASLIDLEKIIQNLVLRRS